MACACPTTGRPLHALASGLVAGLLACSGHGHPTRQADAGPDAIDADLPAVAADADDADAATADVHDDAAEIDVAVAADADVGDPCADCDDGVACTSDHCEPTTGACTHEPVAGCVGLPYATAFPCGQLPLWTLEGDTDGPAWAVDGMPWPPGWHSAPCSLNFNHGKGLQCKGATSYHSASAVTPWFDASHAGADEHLVLHFWRAGDWTAAGTLHLELQIQASPSWVQLDQIPAAQGWGPAHVELDPWRGSIFRLRFRVASGCGPISGFFLDDFVLRLEACQDAADCSDDQPCTTDTCNEGSCWYQATTAGAPCDDGGACTGPDQCSDGACQGQPLTCNDGNACTFDTCSPAKGGCAFPPAPVGVECSDGSPCTPLDSCEAGQCLAGSPLAAGTPCSDGNVCTSGDRCVGTACLPLASWCEDGNPCTQDLCDVTALSKCSHLPVADGTGCSDGEACSSAEVCANGACVGKPQPCSTVWQDAFTCGGPAGWLWSPPTSAKAPSWGVVPATLQTGFISPACVLGIEYTTFDCPPGAPFVAHATSPEIDLAGLPSPTLEAWSLLQATSAPTDVSHRIEVSADGFQTTAIEVLVAEFLDWHRHTVDLQSLAGKKIRVRFVVQGAGSCAVGLTRWLVDDVRIAAAQGAPCQSAASCDDGATCTVDACFGGQCAHLPASGPACDDGFACSATSQCDFGACRHGAFGCDDGKPCTTDTCDFAGNTCTYAPFAEGATCKSAQPCVFGTGTCQSGDCVAVPDPDGGYCFDGDLCSGPDTCQGGTCQPGPPESGTPCGGPCQQQGTCQAGACQPTFDPCNDKNPCTIDQCVGFGCQHVPVAWDLACDDGEPCTTAETCFLGHCIGTWTTPCP